MQSAGLSRQDLHRAALLLDRDGVINVDHGFVARREDFEWRPGIFRLVGIAAASNIPVVVVTNQTGIGRGYYAQSDFDALTVWMQDAFARKGTPIAKVYHCPFHPEATVAELRASHPWRKPEPGMLLAARDDLGLDLGKSVMVGDQWSDMIAAQRAGVGTAVLVGDPKTRKLLPEGVSFPDVICKPDIEAVARWYAGEVRSAGFIAT